MAKKRLYLIMADVAAAPHQDRMVMAWKPGVGCYWTTPSEVKSILNEHPEYNMWPHQFARETPEDTLELVNLVDMLAGVTVKLCYIDVDASAAA